MKHKINKQILLVVSIATFLIGWQSCQTIAVDESFGKDRISITAYLELPEHNGEFSQFLELLEIGGLKRTLTAFNKKSTGYTLMAPTNEAVQAYIERSKNYNSFEELKSDVPFVRSLTRYHLLMSSIERKDFGFGVMGDTTATGDYLTLTYEDLYDQGLDSVRTLVNAYSPISLFDYDAANGTVHHIDVMLEPNVYTTGDWLLNQKGFDIFTEALQQTGLMDTISTLERTNEFGTIIKNTFTMLIEPDSIYNKRGIMNFMDLYNKYNTEGTEITDPANGLYQFVAYHISESDFFLNDLELESRTYNTYSILPFSALADFEGVKVNVGISAVDTIIDGVDTIPVRWVPVLMDQSNVATRNGSVHFVSEILEMKATSLNTTTVSPGAIDPIFSDLWRRYGSPGITHEESFTDPTVFQTLRWTGVNELLYKTAPKSGSSNYQDMIELDGFFDLNFDTKRIFPGKYNVEFDAEANEGSTAGYRAVIQLYIDGIPVGTPIDLNNKIQDSNWIINLDRHKPGSVQFDNYSKHTIRIKTLAKGDFKYYRLRFVPDN